ncbi:MAG: tetratricopeptide repeat protein [Myxococcota bacterium]|nr:tetratricopeptide repeat protein [Myxococcota bacterium]
MKTRSVLASCRVSVEIGPEAPAGPFVNHFLTGDPLRPGPRASGNGSALGRWTICLLAPLVASVAGACGGESPAPKHAPTTTYSPPPARAPVVAGQQTGVATSEDGLTGEAKVAYDRGFKAWLAGDLMTAKSAFGEAASQAPRAGAPRYSLGCVLERLGDRQGALSAYRSAFAANSKYDVAVGAYATLLAQTGRGTDAEQLLAEKSAQNPSSVRLLTFLAEVKSIQGDSAGAQKVAQQALAKEPDSKEAMVVIARDYYRNHMWDLAKYALQAVLDGAADGSIPPRDPGNPEALLLRGLIERETGQRKQALVDFEQAVGKRPDLFESYINLGEMKLEAGNAGEAQGSLEQAVRYAPNVPVAHLDLGDCYRLLGRPADAKAELDKAISMDSTLAGVHYDLGLLYLFSPSVPGVTNQDDQLSKAIHELELFRSMRGAKAVKGPGDDVDELLSTAKRKQSELQLKSQAATAASAGDSGVPAPSTGSPGATLGPKGTDGSTPPK